MVGGPWIRPPVFRREGIFLWLARIPVRIHYSFFLTALLLGSRRRSVGTLVVWIAVVLVAVLLHELGHALAARSCRQWPRIDLHAMGGTTSWDVSGDLRWTQRAAISLAGPGIGFLAALLLLWIPGTSGPARLPGLLDVALHDFLWVTVGWGIFNLLPILPLDGGQTMETLLQRWLGTVRGRVASLYVSVGCAAVLALLAWTRGQVWISFLCALFAYESFERLRGRRGLATRS
jgi:hypothetical protein